ACCRAVGTSREKQLDGDGEEKHEQQGRAWQSDDTDGEQPKITDIFPAPTRRCQPTESEERVAERDRRRFRGEEFGTDSSIEDLVAKIGIVDPAAIEVLPD